MKRIFIIILFAISLGLNAQVKFADYFENKTLRIDYFHSGNHINEYVVPDQIFTEGEWSGNPKSLISDFNYGHHRISVYDSTGQLLIYRRGFSSLFAEYRNTPEAKEHCGNFPESFLLPLPKKTVLIEFSTRNKLNLWDTIKTFYINPSKDIIDRTNPHAFESEKIKYNGSSSNKLDIAFLAEGYTLEEQDKFIMDCNRLASALLSIEPYKKLAGKINIWAVKSISEESGVTQPTKDVYKNTILESSYNTFDMERYLMVTSHHIMRDVASNVPYDQLYVIVNSKTYGGGGIYNFLSVGTADNIMAFLLLWHEFGHDLGGLGDEYVSDDAAFQGLYTAEVEPWEPNITTLKDFDSKWKKMVKKKTPVPTPLEAVKDNEVGVFEGAGYTPKGVYRPMKECVMRSANQKTYCKVCEKEIEKAISFYAD